MAFLTPEDRASRGAVVLFLTVGAALFAFSLVAVALGYLIGMVAA